MKKLQILVACALVLTLAGLATLHAAEEGKKDGKATIRAVHGTVEYQDKDKSLWLPVKPNMKFLPGITIRTGKDGGVDISVNGLTSVVRLTNSTTLQIPMMSYVGSVREGDTTTMLNLMSGTVLGNVKKISANSRYEITTPHGVAGIRGTDFMVEAIPTSDGKFLVTFSSITGLITVSAVIDGQTVTHTLTSQTAWQIGETPKQISATVIANCQQSILNMIQSIAPGAVIGNPVVGGNNNNNNGNNNGTGNTLTPDPHQSDTGSGGGS